MIVYPELNLTQEEGKVNKEQWQKSYLGEFKPDLRLNALIDRLAQYYSDADKYPESKNVHRLWSNFKQWANSHGYTQEEINQAKRLAQQED